MKLDFSNKSPEEIQQILDDSADVVQHETYRKPLSSQEVKEYQDILAKEQVDVFLLEKQKKEMMDRFKEQIKPKKDAIREAAHASHYKEIETEGNVYQMRDQDEGEVYYYAEDGSFIKKRPIRPDERQLTVNSEIRKLGN